MDTLLHDIRYALRKLARTPGFTFVAVATLALAIGATTAIFSIVNGVLLKPLPYRDPERLVLVGSTNADMAGRPIPLSTPDFVNFRDESRSFAGIAPYTGGSLNLTRDEAQPLRLNIARVGASFFDVLGVRAVRGRTFAAGEDQQGADRVTVLSYDLWQTQFAGDPRVVGQQIMLNGEKYTIVGVAPKSLAYPRRAELYVPFVFQPFELTEPARGNHSHYAIARLKDGVEIAKATGELSVIAKRLETQFPTTNTNFGVTLQPLQERIIGNVDKPLYTMFGAVALVLLIACANVANLLLVRASSRESEIAVRTALGAGRGRIVRQLVTESVLLSVGGALVGAALAAWAVDAVVAFGPAGLPRLSEVVIDGRVLAFTAVLAIATGLFFGIVPAYHAARPDIAQMLRESVRGTSKGGTHRTRAGLVVGEMALAVVLLVGAGLFIRSFLKVINVDPGFRPEHVVSFNVSLPNAKYPFERQQRQFVNDLTQRLHQLPGTQEVGVTFGRPLDMGGVFRTSFEVQGRPPRPLDARTITQVHPATSSYFRAMGIPLLRGRAYTTADDQVNAPPVVVVTQEFARRYFPNEEVLGKRIELGINHDTSDAVKGAPSVQVTGEVIGVVGDVKAQDLVTDVYPTVYVPYNKLPIPDIAVLVRTEADPQVVETAARGAVRDLDASLPIYGLMTMEQAISNSVAQPRFYMILLGVFGAIALLLAALGIYGVISYTVSQRTRELGIRIALGATRERVVRQVIGQGVWLTGAGVVLGVAAAAMLTRIVASLIFGVGQRDPLTFLLVPVVLVGVAMLASWLPARRAANVDPVIAMRND